MRDVLNKITKNLDSLGINSETLSDSYFHIKEPVCLDNIEEALYSIEGYRMEFIRVEDITYN